MSKPLFEERVNATLDRCTDIFTNRGAEYGDTWAEARFLVLQSVLNKMEYKIDSIHFKAIAAAVLVDIKYWRNLGGYKDDSMIDGINYQALLAEEMVQLQLDDKKQT